MTSADRLAVEISRLRDRLDAARPFSVANVVATDTTSVTANIDGVEVEIPSSSLVGAPPRAGDRVLVAWQGADPILVGGGIGTGGGSGRPVIVAAVDSSPAAKAAADLVCDGAHDEVEIALAAGQTWRGGAWLAAGTYTLAGRVDLGVSPILRGESRATVTLNVDVGQGITAAGRGVLGGLRIARTSGDDTFPAVGGGWQRIADVRVDTHSAERSLDATVNEVAASIFWGTVRVANDFAGLVAGCTAGTLTVAPDAERSLTVVGCRVAGAVTVTGAGGVTDERAYLVGVRAASITVDAGTDGTRIIGCEGTITDNGAGTVIIDGSGGGGATDLAGLTDVADGLAPSDGQVFTYDTTAGEWDAATLPAPAVTAADVTDDPTGRTILVYTDVDANLDAADAAMSGMYSAFSLLAGTSVASADADYTLALPVRLVTMTGLSAARTVTLPAASGDLASTALTITIRCDATCSASNTVTIVPDGTDTINGAANLVLNTADATARLVVDPAGGNWLTV